MGKVTTYTYNEIGKVESVTDSLNHRTEFTYNSRGQNTAVRDAANNVSSATYDLLGNVTRLAGPLGGATNYTYDDMGRLTSESTVSGGTKSYEYNELNVRTTITNARGQERKVFYDAKGRVTGYISPEGPVSYIYDQNDNVLTVIDHTGSVHRTYDALNRVLSYTDTYGKVIRYEYDAVGNLSKIIYPDNTAVTYAYDANHNLIRVTDWANRVTSYTYDGNNRVIGVTKPDGSVTTTVYDNKQRVTSTVERTATGAIITGFEYTYDDLSRIIEEKHLDKNTKFCYTYDNLSRVTARTVKKLSDNSVVSTETFSYDAAGNVTSAPDSSFQYDTNNRLISFNGNTVSYDLDGNMLSNGTLTCTYDSANRLVSAGGHTYTYNAEDVRIRNLCADENTTYTYDTNCRLSKLLCKTADGVVTKYVYGLGLIGEEVNNSFKTYHFDFRGSTIAITDASGNITDTFAYDTYGKLISRTGTSKIIFGYNGRDGVVTDDNGLIYMRARYYSPEMKRFINADIIPGEISDAITLNRFAYANGNPVSFVDPFGLSAERDVISEETNSWYTGEISGAIHFILDVAGFIPGWGAIADALNAVVYALEGDWVNAGMSALAAIPGFGDIASGCKWATKLFKSSSKIYKALDSVGSFMTKIDDVIKNAEKASDILYVTSKGGDDVASRVAKYSDDMIADYSSRLGGLPDFSKMTRDEIGEWATSGSAYQKGLKGEFLAEIDQSRKRPKSFEIGGRTRIADEVGEDYLKEVKNVKSISYTKQLRDYTEYANKTGLKKKLYVRPGTHVSPAIEAAGWELIDLW